MPSLDALPVRRGEHHRSRQLIRDSRRLIVRARELMGQARQSMARQSYVRVVCAWCQATIRFARSPVTARGQISHSICFHCFAHVFWELEPSPTPPPLPPQTTPGEHPSHGLQLREDARRAGATDPMAGLATHRGRREHPAKTPLTPRAFNEVIPLP
jgi:hypothetical protein